MLRLLAAEGLVALGKLSLDGTKLAGNAAHAANRTLPQIERLLAEAAATDAAEDAELGDQVQPPTPRALARRVERRQRLTRARDRLAGEDQARREAQRAKVEAWDAAAAAGRPRGGQRPSERPRANRAGTEPQANLTDPDVRIMLRDPVPRRMPRHSEYVEPSCAYLEDEEHVDPTQQHRVDREEVTRQHRARLSTAELPPRRTFAARSRIKPGLTQDVPHGRRSHPIAKPDEFAVDPAVTPRRVLPGEPDYQVAYDGRGTRATPAGFVLGG